MVGTPAALEARSVRICEGFLKVAAALPEAQSANQLAQIKTAIAANAPTPSYHGVPPWFLVCYRKAKGA